MIPFFDYRPALKRIRPEIDEAIRRVIDSGRLILGPEVEAFEDEFATRVGRAHAVGVNSGTDALILALRALGIRTDDEVLTVANAGAPTVAAIRATGAEPRFVDVDEDTLLIDVARLAAAIGPRTRCLLPVHLYGRPVPMEPILALAEARDLNVVEDCAQAHGAEWNGRAVGSFGAIGCYSFYPTKNLGALGDGGACVTDDPDLAERLRMERTYGFRGDRESHVEGLNSRLDELQAAMLRVKLRHLDRAIEERRDLASRYLDGLRESSLRLPLDTEPPTRHAYHLFVVRHPDREALLRALRRASIGFGLHYDTAAHRMEAYRTLGSLSQPLPVTERACEEVVSLPLYPGLEAAAVDRVIEVLRELP